MPKRACCFAIFIGSCVMASDGKGISGIESFVYGNQLDMTKFFNRSLGPRYDNNGKIFDNFYVF